MAATRRRLPGRAAVVGRGGLELEIVEGACSALEVIAMAEAAEAAFVAALDTGPWPLLQHRPHRARLGEGRRRGDSVARR